MEPQRSPASDPGWRAPPQPFWLAGQAIGSLDFALHIVVVAISLLSLVQAFAAGGMALSVPLRGTVVIPLG